MPLRNPNINYNKGWFFVTMQVAMNKSIFGLIDDKKCALNDLGKRVAESWRYLAKIYPATYFDEFVLMPNHVHTIVKVGTEAHPYDNIVEPRPLCRGLSKIIHSFKSFTANKIYRPMVKDRLCPDIGASLWQSSYYDNLITSHDELERIRAYIRNNPAKWDDDRFGPVTTYHLGDIELLHGRLVAYVASSTPGAEARGHDRVGAEGGGYDRVGHLHDKVGAEGGGYDRANIVGADLRARTLISTFTSPQEREVMRHCLAAKEPFVWVRPGGLPTTIYGDLQAAINEGRALLLSPVPEGTGVNKQRAIWCNRYVLNQAKEVQHGAISRGGMLETLLKAKGINF